MKRFDIVKTIQMVLIILIAAAALTVIFSDGELYAMIAADSHVRFLCLLLWILTGISLAFLFYDFNSYTALRRENIELDNAVWSDPLTGIANRYSADVYLSRHLNRPLNREMGCLTIDLTCLGEINARHGHTGGDTAIRAFSDILQRSFDGNGFIGRNGGNKFLVIIEKCTEQKLNRLIAMMEENTDQWNQNHPDMILRWQAGRAFQEGEEAHTLTELVALSDRRAHSGMIIKE